MCETPAREPDLIYLYDEGSKLSELTWCPATAAPGASPGHKISPSGALASTDKLIAKNAGLSALRAEIAVRENREPSSQNHMSFSPNNPMKKSMAQPAHFTPPKGVKKIVRPIGGPAPPRGR